MNNVVELHKFLYNDQDYTPSSEVVARSNKILEIVGGEGELDDAAKTTTQDTDTANTADTFVWSGDNTSGSDYNYDNDYDNSGSDSSGGYDNGGGYDNSGSDSSDGYDNGGGYDNDGSYDNGGNYDTDDTGGGDYAGGNDGFTDDSSVDYGTGFEEQ